MSTFLSFDLSQGTSWRGMMHHRPLSSTLEASWRSWLDLIAVPQGPLPTQMGWQAAQQTDLRPARSRVLQTCLAASPLAVRLAWTLPPSAGQASINSEGAASLCAATSLSATQCTSMCDVCSTGSQQKLCTLTMHDCYKPFCAGGSATANQNFHQASAAPEDLFGGLSTTQPAGSSAAGDGDMFGGLSLGATAGSASAAPLTGGSAKQPQTAAAPFDADLFGGAMNGHSSQSVPMGIPQQVVLLEMLFLVCTR